MQLSATEAEYNQVKEEAGRVIELYNRGSVPVNDYDKAVAGVKQITAKYNAHKNALADTRLTAPFDGYIQKKYYDSHETVAAGYPVVSMINSNYFDVDIDIPSSDFVRQDLFKAFSCTIDVFPGQVFPLELIEITRKANLNQLYRMRLRLKPVPGVDIAAGMSVNVTIEYNPNEEALTVVPLSAMFEENGVSAVWVYSPETQRVTKRVIQLKKLLKTGELIVSGGLAAGEIVVSAGVHSLKEGMSVELLKPVSKTNVGGLL
ncbi:MAG: efflux RND transporter periplasmic adaptor subunit [Butyricimonas faecihominis]